MTSPSERDRAAIYAHYGLTCPPRWATLRNFDNPTYGPKVAKIAARLGTPFNPWQRYQTDVSLEVDPRTGLFLYRDIGCTVPRQSGKTSVILPLAAHRGMAWNRQHIVYAAQNGTSARKKWEDDQLPALAAAGFIPAEGGRLLPRHKARVRKANGREAIIWRKTQSIHGLHANTERAGHGPTQHLGLLDEYFAQIDNRISAAWSPAMITVPDAQFYWYSTMGTSKSVPMNEDVTAGREIVESGAPTRRAYFEWSAPPGSDYTDPAVWLACMPSLCPDEVCRCSDEWRHTVTVPVIQAELEKATTPAKLAEFIRAYMNIKRDDDEVAADPNVPSPEAWALLADKAAARGSTLALAIDVTPSADYASISAVGEGPDGPGGAPIGVLLDHGPGTAWVVRRAVELAKLHNPVAWVLDGASRARELIEPLRRAGITPPAKGKKFARGDLWIPTTGDVGAAAGSLCVRVKTGNFIHRGQQQLVTAIAGSRTRSIGPDGLFAFGRKVSTCDISPLVTFSLALAAYEQHRDLADPDYDVLDSIG